VEYIALRVYIHSTLGVRIGWGTLLTDYDLFIPLPCAFIVYVILLDRKIPLSLRIFVPELLFHLFSLFIFLWFNLNYAFLYARLGFAFQCAWWACALLLFSSAIFIWSGRKFFLSNPNRSAIVICGIMAITTILSTQFGEVPWKAISAHMSEWVCGTLRPVLGRSVSCDVRDGYHLFLVHRLLAIKIAKGCGGLDGYLLMCSALSIVSALVQVEFSIFEYLIFGLLGFLLMSLLNVLRIGLIFFMGIRLIGHFGENAGTSVLETAFHAHLGWILYGVGLYYFVRLLFSWDESKFRRKFSPKIPVPLVSPANNSH
jgi:exosortase/archaeosortase family protein